MSPALHWLLVSFTALIERISRALGELEPMNSGRWCTLTNSTAAARSLAVIVAILGLLCSSANAVQPPADHCRAASKIEYDSAKNNFCCATDLALMSEPGVY